MPEDHPPADPYRHLRVFAAAVIINVREGLDEDATYTGTALNVHLTGLANGVLSGTAELPEFKGVN
jgi:hypothetical protein